MSETDDHSLPSAPQTPLKFDAYANIGFVPIENQKIDLLNDASATIRPVFQNVPHLTEEEARAALAQFVSEHCCYGKAPLTELTFSGFESSNTHRYVLQTYTETRSTAYATEPYSGAPIYITGQPLQPWDIAVVPKILFNNEVHKIEIPNTAHVENCVKCFGVGTKQCSSCQGRGTKTCWICNGSGRAHVAGQNNPSYDTFHDHHHGHQKTHHDHHSHHQHSNPCGHCSGTGFAGCNVCHRAGRIQCHCCKGSGKLKWFLQLTVSFKNNEDDFLKKSNVIPDDLIRKCQAHNAFSEQNIRIYPISTFPDPDINQASYNLLNTHANKFNNCRIIAQRQDVYVIPVTLCTYMWKNEVNTFHVFGLDHSVYSPDYPKKCCCSIL